MYVKWKLVSVRLEIVLVSVHDRCTICTEHIIGLEIMLTQLMVLLCDVGQVETHFGPFRDRVHLDARWVHGLR
jgi:hypothetical protein